MPDLAPVFAELREIMAPYAAELDVKRDDETELYLDTRPLQKHCKPLFFGAVQLEKSCVGFHLMPVHRRPGLLDSASPGLRARMQGKSCFSFAKRDPELLEELARLTRSAFASDEEQGFV